MGAQGGMNGWPLLPSRPSFRDMVEIVVALPDNHLTRLTGHTGTQSQARRQLVLISLMI